MPGCSFRELLVCMVVALFVTGCGDDCEPLGQELATVSAAAERCDPNAATPCSAFYTGCVYIGIDPRQAERLSALVEAYKQAECVKAPPPCPADLGPPLYVCQAIGDGANVCAVAQ